jgi:hypothetical protein
MTMRVATALALAGAASCVAAPLQGLPWTRHEIDNSLRGADGVRLADANGDGLLDVVTSWEQSGKVRVYINPGQCGARDPWLHVTVGVVESPEDAIIVDLDGDGAMDVVTSTEEGSRTMFVHWAPSDPAEYLNAGAWTTAEFPNPPACAWMVGVPAQIDNQDGVDLVIASRQPDVAPYITQIGWLRCPPGDRRNLDAWTYHTTGFVYWAMSVFVRDMNYDGLPDIVLTDRHGWAQSVRWFRHPGYDHVQLTGVWNMRIIGNLGEQCMLMDVEDIDGDGLDDIAVPVHPNKIYWHERLDLTAEKWEEHRVEYPSDVGKTKSLEIADVDGDGHADLVLSCSNAADPLRGVVWLRNPGNPTQLVWDSFDVSGPEGVKFDLTPLIDLDGDGDLDIISTDENDNAAGPALGIVWFENPSALASPDPADLNTDGAIDFTDLNIVLSAWGQSGPDLAGDVDGDGFVGFADVNAVLSGYGEGSCE